MEIIYGPLLEEFVYRGILYTLLKQAWFNGYLSAIFSSLTFSLSHFRHIFDIYFNKSDIKIFAVNQIHINDKIKVKKCIIIGYSLISYFVV